MAKKLLTAALFIFILTTSVASAPLSHALDIIRSKTSYTVSVSDNKAYSFSKEDFLSAVGCPFENIVIKSLVQNGVLKFGVDEVKKGAVISKSELSALRYIPDGELLENVSFTFNTNDSHSMSDYTLVLSSKKSGSPAAAGASFETYRAVAVIKDLSEINGEGYTYHTVSAAEHGTLTLSQDGRFTYTPYADFVGRDSFEFCIKDENGNLSAAEKVEIRVRRPYKNLCFTDMVGRENHAEAIRLCEEGFADVMRNTEGKPIFLPDAPLTRAEFISWTMGAAGIEHENLTIDTADVFLDADTVSPKYESAVSAAVKLGYIRGRNVDGQSLIEANSAITLHEAVTVISRILEEEIPLPSSERVLTRGEGAALVFELMTDK